MTKKDYELIAEAIQSALLWSLSDQRDDGIRAAALSIADTLKLDNPRFNRAKFLKAAGVSE